MSFTTAVDRLTAAEAGRIASRVIEEFVPLFLDKHVPYEQELRQSICCRMLAAWPISHIGAQEVAREVIEAYESRFRCFADSVPYPFELREILIRKLISVRS